MLRLEWGPGGLEKALKRNDNIVIIDTLRFSSTMVTASSLGFVVKPTADKSLTTEGFSLSPPSFFGKAPRTVVIASPNGASLSMLAKGAKRVAYGAILNAKAAAGWADGLGGDASLVAAGESTPEGYPFRKGRELELSKENSIFATEDLLGAGAIAWFSRMEKSGECEEAEISFEREKAGLLEALKDTASGGYLESKGKGEDVVHCSKLNLYNVVPELRVVDGALQISAV